MNEDYLPIGQAPHADHIHSDEVMEEYTSTGPNILGEIVTCKMAKIICMGCQDESVKFISSVTPIDKV